MYIFCAQLISTADHSTDYETLQILFHHLLLVLSKFVAELRTRSTFLLDVPSESTSKFCLVALYFKEGCRDGNECILQSKCPEGDFVAIIL
jgi:hypothetical protein